jgi:hypothetical protein
MGKRKHLCQRQLDVLRDLFESDLDEQKVLAKHGVRRSTYNRWLAEEVFGQRWRHQVNALGRESELLLAKSSRTAAQRLVKLLKCKSGETARKTCLDIMRTPKELLSSEEGGSEVRARVTVPYSESSKVWAALAKAAKEDAAEGG